MNHFNHRGLFCQLLIIASLVGCAPRTSATQPSHQLDSSSSSACVNSSGVCQIPFFYLYGGGREALAGQLIIVRGYYVVDGGVFQLYPDRDSAEHRIRERAVKLAIPPSMSQTEVSIDIGGYVDVRGRLEPQRSDGFWATIEVTAPPQAIPIVVEGELPPAPPPPKRDGGS